jgi:hypothetical protein
LYTTRTLKFRSLGNSKGARIEVEAIDRDDGSIVLHIARGENSANDFSALLRLFFDEMRKLPLQQLARFLGDKGAGVLKALPAESEVPFEAFERLGEMMHLLLAYPTKNVVLVAPGPDAPPEGALVEIAFGYFMDEPVELPGFAHGAPPEERVNIHTTTVVISDTEPLNSFFDTQVYGASPAYQFFESVGVEEPEELYVMIDAPPSEEDEKAVNRLNKDHDFPMLTF